MLEPNIHYGIFYGPYLSLRGGSKCAQLIDPLRSRILSLTSHTDRENSQQNLNLEIISTY